MTAGLTILQLSDLETSLHYNWWHQNGLKPALCNLLHPVWRPRPPTLDCWTVADSNPTPSDMQVTLVFSLRCNTFITQTHHEGATDYFTTLRETCGGGGGGNQQKKWAWMALMITAEVSRTTTIFYSFLKVFPQWSFCYNCAVFSLNKKNNLCRFRGKKRVCQLFGITKTGSDQHLSCFMW